MRNNQPARQNKQQDEMEELKQFLQSDLIIRIEYYVILTILMIICMIICFAVQPQTYGFLWW